MRKQRSQRAAVQGMLERLDETESAAVLKALLLRHEALRGEAEEIARAIVSSVSVEDTAGDVFCRVTSVDLEALNGRAGRKPWGYLEPTEAAWELLGEAVEDTVSDMKRRIEFGLIQAAEALCRGLVVGLRRAREFDSDGVLGWAPDFPEEEACRVVHEILDACPRDTRGATRDRLIQTLSQDVPDWAEMLTRAATKNR